MGRTVSDVIDNSRGIDGVQPDLVPVSACDPIEPANGTLATPDVVDSRSRGQWVKGPEYQTWRRERAGILATLDRLRAELAAQREQLRSLRAIVQGREDTPTARERALWVRARLAEVEGVHKAS